MSAVLLLAGLVALLPGSSAYSNGPPVSKSGLCTNMFPTGHSALTQTGTSPFEIRVNSDCYKPNMEIQVVIKTVTGKAAKIEGLFVQARKQSGSQLDIAVGTFRTDDSVLSALECNGLQKSALGHNRKEKSYWREAVWKAPASGLTEDIRFRATVVEHKDIFWVALETGILKYKTSCDASANLVNSASALKYYALIILAAIGLSVLNLQRY